MFLCSCSPSYQGCFASFSHRSTKVESRCCLNVNASPPAPYPHLSPLQFESRLGMGIRQMTCDRSVYASVVHGGVCVDSHQQPIHRHDHSATLAQRRLWFLDVLIPACWNRSTAPPACTFLRQWLVATAFCSSQLSSNSVHYICRYRQMPRRHSYFGSSVVSTKVPSPYQARLDTQSAAVAWRRRRGLGAFRLLQAGRYAVQHTHHLHLPLP
ncbi:hypothetical protein B0T22DRAFT_459332 [Podospora appendiculata]|uniref:Uncharacterized protein n=1 Tax=Podospora appendiculata TaxID=314037 RepID=A0AAE1CCD7_9PEZI|nr:hypothetical protein B0T22DRAFT_459332 [Podospora appendiculata]